MPELCKGASTKIRIVLKVGCFSCYSSFSQNRNEYSSGSMWHQDMKQPIQQTKNIYSSCYTKEQAIYFIEGWINSQLDWSNEFKAWAALVISGTSQMKNVREEEKQK